ncbi:MAG: winged helix-turn-helix transcriptional regulator [Verrucomicrobia bacterium]|nr:winged helix-turn-helix transcriptional regulator [Verrucomicrobiota bacterium]
MSASQQIASLQRAYPQVWFACHLDHRTRSNSPDGLTDREAGILAHLDATDGALAGDVARHLGIGKSTLSAQLKRLVELGFVRLARGDDQRERPVHLTAKGRRAVVARSPLDRARVGALLQVLTPAERVQAVAGLELLARAARQLRAQHGKEVGA